MMGSILINGRSSPRYHGVRMSATEYFAAEDDGFRYELVDGVMVTAPSPTRRHQGVVTEILFQITAYLRDNPVGDVWPDLDVHLGPKPDGEDLVYRPDIVFVRVGRLSPSSNYVDVPPDLVVEVVSGLTRRYDSETKRDDYERFGVGEYWLVDPELNQFTVFRRVGERFAANVIEADSVESSAISGFVLDVARVRGVWGPSR